MTRSFPLLLLSACGAPDTAKGEAIECAVDGGRRLERSCTLERQPETLLLHHPSGGFRRLRVGREGLAAADGADPASVSVLVDGRVEVRIAGDRYRLPAGTTR